MHTQFVLSSFGKKERRKYADIYTCIYLFIYPSINKSVYLPIYQSIFAPYDLQSPLPGSPIPCDMDRPKASVEGVQYLAKGTKLLTASNKACPMIEDTKLML